MEARAEHDKHLTPDDPKVTRWFRCPDPRAVKSVAKYPALAHWLRLVDPTLLINAFFDEKTNLLVLATSSQKLYESCRSRVGTLRHLEIGLAIGLFQDDKIVAYFGETDEYFVRWREGKPEHRVMKNHASSVKRTLRKGEKTMAEYRSLLTSVAPFLPWQVRQDVDKGWVRLLELNGCYAKLGFLYADAQYRAEVSLKGIEDAFAKRFGQQQFTVKIERLKYRSRPAK